MSRFLLDTNAVIALLRGNAPLGVTIASAEWVGISIITKLEFLSFGDLTEADADLFSRFESRVDVVDLTNTQAGFVSEVVRLRKSTRVKLPDAIIIASATANRAKLVTADAQLLNQCPEQTVSIAEITTDRG
jgi:tRNA(fMet)-specific endonuclease VapC